MDTVAITKKLRAHGFYSLESIGLHMAFKIVALMERMGDEWIGSSYLVDLEKELEKEFLFAVLDGNIDLFPLIKLPDISADGKLKLTARRSIHALVHSGIVEAGGRTNNMTYRLKENWND